MDRKRLADKIAADILKTDKPRNANVVPCVTCGRPTLIQDGNPDRTFCQDRCREALDTGLLPPFSKLPPITEVYTKTWRVVAPVDGDPGYMPRPMRMGKHGFIIACANCHQEFDSKGFRCCSPECERSYRSKEKRAAVMDEIEMEPVTKRTCQAPGCGSDIPNWRNGRRVHQDTKYCSRTCAQKARRTEGD